MRHRSGMCLCLGVTKLPDAVMNHPLQAIPTTRCGNSLGLVLLDETALQSLDELSSALDF